MQTLQLIETHISQVEIEVPWRYTLPNFFESSNFLTPLPHTLSAVLAAKILATSPFYSKIQFNLKFKKWLNCFDLFSKFFLIFWTIFSWLNETRPNETFWIQSIKKYFFKTLKMLFSRRKIWMTFCIQLTIHSSPWI